MTIGQEIIAILRDEILKDESFDIGEDVDLLTTGTLHSMALIRLVACIETKYDIKIPPTDLVIENFLNIKAMETYISKTLAK